jgi:hypothetical protein
VKIQHSLAHSVLEPLAHGATFVLSRHDSQSHLFTSIVRGAENSAPQLSIIYEISHYGQPRTYYARTVMYRLPLEGVESLSTKCQTEKVVTDQEFVLITPVVDGDVDPMELLKLTKRLVLCTSCGNLRLIN